MELKADLTLMVLEVDHYWWKKRAELYLLGVRTLSKVHLQLSVVSLQKVGKSVF